MKYSKDKRVSFDERTHSYFLGKKRLKSVTTFINDFKNEFDSDYWSKIIAERENVTQEEILIRWKKKAFKSTEIGTAIHKIFEDYTNNKYSKLNDSFIFDYNILEDDFLIEFNSKRNISIKFINDFFETKRLTPIETEFIVYNEFLAGQIDMICKDENDNFYILDFKTNSEIKKDSYNKKMKFPFDIIDDCSFYHYSLQLSIYKELIKEYSIRDLFLIHITESKYTFIKCEDLLNNELKKYLNG